MRDGSESERRDARRQTAAECAWLTSARLRTGLEVAVIDLASGGALIEAPARLLPGATVELHLAAPGWRWFASARVLRCCVFALVAEEGVRYRAALRFDRCLEAPGPETERGTAEEPSPPSKATRPMTSQSTGSHYPETAAPRASWEETTRGRPTAPARFRLWTRRG